MVVRVALALGSGGARGYAHIGVLEVLAERGYEVVTIAGTSMGALVGGVAAAGKLEEYTDWARSLTQRQVLRLLDPTITGGGALRAERVIDKVAGILGGVRIEDCPIPFTAVATDLNNRREVWFQRGPVHTAIRASIAIPTVITPVVVDGRLLVDGGLMNPVPIEPNAATVCDLTVAVSLSGPRARPAIDIAAAEPANLRGLQGTLGDSLRLLTSRLSALRGQVAPEEIAEAEVARTEAPQTETPEATATAARMTEAEGNEAAAAKPAEASDRAPAQSEPGSRRASATPRAYVPALKPTAMADIVSASLDAMGAMIARYRMAANPPDVLVSIPTDACRTMDFHRAAELIAIGREQATRALASAGY